MNHIIDVIKKSEDITLLSHVDMDGYVSQELMRNYILSTGGTKPKLINMQYGEEPELGSGDLLIVTDLHFSNEKYDEYRSMFDNVVWVDHHKCDTPARTVNQDHVYIFDRFSATRLVSIILDIKDENMLELINRVNAADIFDKKDKFFFEEGRELTFLLNKLFEMGYEDNRDNIGRQFAKTLVNTITDPYEAFGDVARYITHLTDRTLLDIQTEKLYDEMQEKALFKEDGLIIVPTTNISDIADIWLMGQSMNQLFVGINAKKNTVSFRSADGTAHRMAELFGGGGHANASGCKFNGEVSIDEIKNAIVFNYIQLTNKKEWV